MSRQVVIETSTGIVRRHGYVDFTPTLAAGESIITSDFVFAPAIDVQRWKWNGSTFVVATLSLTEHKAAVTRKLAYSVTVYIEKSIGPDARQRSLLSLYANAQATAKVNRLAHVKLAADWIEIVLTDYVTRGDTIDAAVSEAAVDAVSLDFSNNDASKPNPMPTIKSTLAIAT